MIEPYPFQSKIITGTKEAFFAGYNSPLVVSPTGSGKTIMFAVIAHGAMRKNSRVLILVHRKEILEQTLDKLFQLGVQAGQIAAGKPLTRDKIQVAMVGTLVRRLNLIKKPDLIIIDEAHHAVAGQWQKILSYFKDVKKIGFTATPIRLDGAGLSPLFDTMIKGPQISRLVKDGYLAYPMIKNPDKELMVDYHVKRGDFDKEEQYQKMSHKSIVGDVIEHYRKYFNGAPVVCYCVSIKHCQLMTDVFSDAGYNSMMVYGNMPRNERERAIKGLADGSQSVLTSCDVISEGVDIPVMAGCIQLRRTLSLSLDIQQKGRSIRIYPGKHHAIILDHVGNIHLPGFGHLLTDREWSLDAKKGDHKYKPPTTTACPKCNGVWPGEPRTCPGLLPSGQRCEFVFSHNDNIADQQRKLPEVIAGELVDALPPGTDPDLIAKLQADALKMQNMSPKTRQKFMIRQSFELQDKEKIAALAKAVGYQKGYAHFVWTKIMGNR